MLLLHLRSISLKIIILVVVLFKLIVIFFILIIIKFQEDLTSVF